MAGSLFLRDQRRAVIVRGSALALCLCSATALYPSGVRAQPPPEPAVDAKLLSDLVRPPVPVGSPSDEAAPDWLVWRAFHGSLEFYGRSGSSVVQELLYERSGLTSAEASVVLAAGQDYLARLKLIDDDARQDISNRFGRRREAATGAQPAEPEIASRDRIPARAPDGRPIEEVLAADGFIERVQQQRAAAFRQHWESLAATIGLEKLVALERFIEAEVAPKVHVATHGMPVSPPPSVSLPPEPAKLR